MGLFSKKSCDICKSDIGLLSNKKLKDGNMCKECYKKLSIWFDDAKNTTIEDIKKQLADREENRKKLDNFETTYAFGEFGCILIDTKNKQFVALPDTSDGLLKSAKTITSIEEIINKNPDIIKFSQIEDVDIDITETTREEKQTIDGQQVSYNPKHITYMESFTIRIKVNHPYIKYVYIPLENGSIHIPCEEPRKISNSSEKIATWLLDLPEARIENQEKAYDNNSFKDMILRNPYEMPDYAFGFKCSLRNKEAIEEYRCMLLMAKQIKNILEEK